MPRHVSTDEHRGRVSHPFLEKATTCPLSGHLDIRFMFTYLFQDS